VPELQELVSGRAAKTIINDVDFDTRHLAAHPDLTDLTMLHNALQMERADIELPVDDSKFAGVNRRTVKTILLILVPVTSTILLRDLRSTPGFSPPPGSQLPIHSAYHNLGGEEIR